MSLERTLGDGMDNALIALTDSANENIPFQLKLRSSKAILKAMKPVKPQGKVTIVIPKYVPKEIKKPKYLTSKRKEPKFIPYEPFKGAVGPIIPVKKQLKVIKDKNNIDIHELVTQMTEMRTLEMDKIKLEAIENKDEIITRKQWEQEKEGYDKDIKNLRETNSHLENQLKFQAQVNSELKTLLVAAVGEDLESRVQHLTEDKLQLARMLLNSANRLTSHQEQTEWLSGQCEVWRSKFLASSLMVEELARWKSVLTQRIQHLEENLKVLIEERSKTRKFLLKTLINLKEINDNHFKLDGPKLKTTNIIDLSIVNYRFSENIGQFVMGGDFNLKRKEFLSDLPSNTMGELKSIQLLKNPVSLNSKPDAICNAVMGAAFSMGSGQKYLNNQVKCCAHCKGDVQDI
ncbi:golgin-45 [Onthophagus taurus]|uniref:golgin-45 n=1 Tax=Onthophagus taurus TaxID=166361 RepID=UPI0039BDB814